MKTSFTTNMSLFNGKLSITIVFAIKLTVLTALGVAIFNPNKTSVNILNCISHPINNSINHNSTPGVSFFMQQISHLEENGGGKIQCLFLSDSIPTPISLIVPAHDFFNRLTSFGSHNGSYAFAKHNFINQLINKYNSLRSDTLYNYSFLSNQLDYICNYIEQPNHLADKNVIFLNADFECKKSDQKVQKTNESSIRRLSEEKSCLIYIYGINPVDNPLSNRSVAISHPSEFIEILKDI